MNENLIEINDLYVEYKSNKGIIGGTETIHAVNGVNLKIKKGEILAVAGESGCGKSTLARSIIRLEQAKSGEIKFLGENIVTMNKKEMKHYRRTAQMVFQNPYSSLNPKMKIIDTLREPLEINTNYCEEEICRIVHEKIKKVGLGEECLNLYPHEFSGGQRQRIAIARALVLEPQFILADEPVSALDVSIQAQIINLLKELKEDYNLTFMLITHDMSVIKYLADRVAIMYLGEIVEIGKTTEIFNTPKHPYTQALLSAVPQISGNESERIILSGDLPSPANLPDGCKFHTRCPRCFEKCTKQHSVDIKISDSHYVKCFLYE